MTGIMKTQNDWISPALHGVRITQDKTLAVMQLSRGSRSFLRRLVRVICPSTASWLSIAPHAIFM